MRTIVHLVTGGKVQSKTTPNPEPTEVEKFREFLGDMLKSERDDGWFISVDTETGWAMFPRSSVLYVQVEGV